MSSIFSSSLAINLSLGAATLYVLRRILSSRLQTDECNKPLPPGPKPKLLLGNLTDLPTSHDWVHWAKHKDLYGPISSVTVFGQHLIIINDAQVAFDLLEKRSSIYSDRPTLVFGGEMCGWENTLALQHYSERSRAYRKHMHTVLGSRAAVARFQDHMTVETRRLMWKIWKNPDGLAKHIRTNAGAIILKISHGYTIEPHESDPLIDLADEAVVQFSLSSAPGMWMVDVLPFLRYVPSWMPGAGFQRTAARWKKTLTELAEKPHAFVKQQMARGTAFPSYTSALLEKGELSEEEEFVVKWSAASMYSGGADTTVSALHSFFLAMLLYPSVQDRAQAELDAVLSSLPSDVGADAARRSEHAVPASCPTGRRLPTYADRASLPYIDAVLKEVLRWMPVTPMGLPHVVTEEDEYLGYRVPKGALILPNIWQFTHDPEKFHEPESFKPERFLGVGGRAPEMDTHFLNFGFGRRICPGKELADQSLWLAIAMSLALFNICKPVDPVTGAVVEPVVEPCTGIISHPKPFRASITPRSERAANLIASVVEEHPWDESDAKRLKEVRWEN